MPPLWLSSVTITFGREGVHSSFVPPQLGVRETRRHVRNLPLGLRRASRAVGRSQGTSQRVCDRSHAHPARSLNRLRPPEWFGPLRQDSPDYPPTSPSSSLCINARRLGWNPVARPTRHRLFATAAFRQPLRVPIIMRGPVCLRSNVGTYRCSSQEPSFNERQQDDNAGAAVDPPKTLRLR